MENTTFRDAEEHQRSLSSKKISLFFNLAKNINALKGKSVKELFSNEENIRLFIEQLSENDFIELINGLNGIVRGAKKEDWGFAKGKSSIEGSMDSEAVFTPRKEDRQVIISKLFNSIQKMNRQSRGLEDIAVVTAVVLNALHPWVDANGRTTRILFFLLTEANSASFEKRINDLISEEGRFQLQTDARSINGDLLDVLKKKHKMTFTNLFSEVPANKFNFSDGISANDKEEFIKAYKAESFTEFAIAINDFLQKRNNDSSHFFKDFPEHRVLMFNLLLPTLSQRDFEEIFKIWYDIKREKVELLIDCIENPDDPQYLSKTKDGKVIKLLDKLKSRVVLSKV